MARGSTWASAVLLAALAGRPGAANTATPVLASDAYARQLCDATPEDVAVVLREGYSGFGDQHVRTLTKDILFCRVSMCAAGASPSKAPATAPSYILALAPKVSARAAARQDEGVVPCPARLITLMHVSGHSAGRRLSTTCYR